MGIVAAVVAADIPLDEGRRVAREEEEDGNNDADDDPEEAWKGSEGEAGGGDEDEGRDIGRVWDRNLVKTALNLGSPRRK